MRLLHVFCIALLSLLGCASEPPSETARQLHEVFFVVLQEQQRSRVGPPLIENSGNSMVLVLPVKADTLIDAGARALPVLEGHRNSHRFEEARLADMCIAIITARQVKRAVPFLDEQGGVYMVSRTVVP